MVGASTGYRRAAAREDQVARMRTELLQRAALISRLSADVQELRRQLGSSRLQAQHAVTELETARRQLKVTNDELVRLEERAADQQRDLEALQSCLGGTLFALQSLAGNDRFGALQHLVTVDSPCRAAYRLLSAPIRGN